MADDQIIDIQRAEELRAEVGDSDFAEIAGLSLEELIETADTLLSETDPAARSNAFHGMKGAALNLGFTQVARLCAVGERAPEAACVTEVTRACAAARAAFAGRYADVIK